MLSSSRFSGQALVIGGSISGLLSARVLSDHFEQVTVLERDLIPTEPEPRQGVPQSFHGHVLLAQGLTILEQLFPGFREQLLRHGAVKVDLLADYVAQMQDDIWVPRFPSGLITYGCTRNLVEWVARKRLSELKNVNFLASHQVLGLTTDAANTAVTGVRSRPRQSAETQIEAQFVVDASGRSSRTPQWLQTIGYEKPKETLINPQLTYGSRMYQIPEGWNGDWKGILLGPKGEENPRSAILITVEGDRWLVTTGGYGDTPPPQDDAGFLDFVSKLRSPVLYEALKDAEPLSPVYRYRGTVNRWRHYEDLPHWPENFVVIGDAACAFNPTHGKGITNAALSAVCLAKVLEKQSTETPVGLSRRFQTQLAKANADPWREVLEQDLRLYTIEGEPSAWSFSQLLRPYLEQVMGTAMDNPQIFTKVLQAIHQLKPRTTLLEPDVVLQIATKVATEGWQDINQFRSSTIPRKEMSKAELERNLEHQYIVSNNVRLHYVTQGEGPLMLMLHGFPEFWYSWRHQIPEFAQDYKVVALDLRGYNNSEKPQDANAYRMPELIKDIQGVIKGLGYDQCVLVGHDWGGGIAWCFADAHPDMVQKLIVMNIPHPANFVSALRNNFQQMMRSWYIGFFQLPVLPELMFQANDYGAIASAFTDRATNKNAFTPEDLEAFKNAAAKRGALTAMVNYYRSNTDTFDREWGMIDVPTLLLWGEDDFALGKELTNNTDAYVRDLTLHYLPNCSHWTQQEQPEQVNQYMRSFLNASHDADREANGH